MHFKNLNKIKYIEKCFKLIKNFENYECWAINCQFKKHLNFKHKGITEYLKK